jgi:serine/threonine-protein kinase
MMNYPTSTHHEFPTPETPKPSADGDRGLVSRKVRCRLAVGSAPGLTTEMSSLLRSRLRLAILIVLCGFSLHTLRNLLLPVSEFDQLQLRWAIAVGEMTVMVCASALLWSRRPLSMRTLRALELTVFGCIAGFFAWLQAAGYHDGSLFRAAVPGQEAVVFRLAGVSAALRWFLLIVLYGVFIPNTWRRCAAVVGSLALVPVVMMVVGSLLDPTTAGFVLAGLPETLIVLATGVAIAVFGSYKIRQLHEKAHEAERIGQYECKEILGIGGMGAVYLAEHVLLRRPCAIKVIRPDQAGDPKTLMRFEREVRAAAKLTHWNTIEIFDYGHTEDGTFYYVMEYLPGMNLEDVVEQHGPMPPERAVHLLRQVCQALREAHAIGLIHRDVKPSNIFASERGKVYDVAKLLDFGLVKTFGIPDDSVRLTREGALSGSPAFMSPEQALAREQLDARTDIYNVGAVAYYLMTGKLPFERESAIGMLHAHAYEPFAPVEEYKAMVPADLQRVIARCLEKDPELRYPDARTLDQALANCESAGQWTAERAEEWWQRHGDGTRPVDTPGRDANALLAGRS